MPGHVPDWCRQNMSKTAKMADGGEATATSTTSTRAMPNLTKGMSSVAGINFGPTTPPVVNEPPPEPKPAAKPTTATTALAKLFGNYFSIFNRRNTF